MPTVWDETRVLNAELDEWITVARRKGSDWKGSDWYVGTITNTSGRIITVPLNFLLRDQYTVDLYRDASDAVQNPNHLSKQTRTVKSSDVIRVELAPGGGQVMRLKTINMR